MTEETTETKLIKKLEAVQRMMEEKKREEEEKKREEWERGRIVEIDVELDALTSAPVWEDHQRGKNWLAKISLDPRSPNGVGRTFADKAHGRNYFYMLPQSWGPGTPVEFGADYYTGSDRKCARRWYGVIVERADDKVVLEHYKDPRTTVKAAEKLRAEMEQSKERAEEAEPKPVAEMNLDELKALATAEITRMTDVDALRDLVNALTAEPEHEEEPER